MLQAWSFPWRGTVLGTGLALQAFVPPAIAASVGEARTLSHLGEPLRVEIPLQSDDRLPPECVRIAPPEGATEDIPWVRGAQAAITEQGPTRKRLLITTPRPINTPVLMLGVHIACGVQIRREYALLIDPPGLDELTAAPAGAAVPAPTVETEAVPPGLRRTQEGETPATIAAALLPGRRSAQSRLAREIVAANGASLGANAQVTTPFPAGSLISVPPLPASPPPASASRPAPAAPAEDAAPPPPRRAPARPQLRIGSGAEAGLQMSLSLGQYRELKEPERERLRTEMQLLSVLDEKIATQIELSDRLRRLEALQEQLRKDATRLETELQQQGQNPPAPASAVVPPPAAASAPPAAPRPQAAPAPVADDTSRLPWLGGALLLVILALAAWVWRRRRQQRVEPLESLAVSSPEAAMPVAPDAMEDLFEPLNEADIWPERDAGATPATGNVSPRSAAAVEGALGPMSVAGLGPASMLQIDDNVEEHDSAVELAEIMMSFGRVHGAAQTLADFIRSNPKQAVKPWIKLLEVYRAANMRAEFDALCAQLNKTFNVKPVGWDDFEGALHAPESLENLPHIAAKLCTCWGKRECQAYLHELLRDNRQGTRQGFPLAIIDEILLLLAILESQLGAYRPDEAAPPETAVTAAPPDTVPVANEAPMLPPLDLSQVDAAKVAAERSVSITEVDFDLDGVDFSRTLHINLDELEPTDTGELPALSPAEPSSRKR